MVATLGRMHPVYTVLPYFLMSHSIIILPSMPLSSAWYLPFWFSYQNFYVYLSHACYMRRFYFNISQQADFYVEELLVPRPKPKLEDRLLSAVRDCFLQYIRIYLPFLVDVSSVLNSRTCHAVVTGIHIVINILKYSSASGNNKIVQILY